VSFRWCRYDFTHKSGRAYETSLGFFDKALAAPSMKAAHLACKFKKLSRVAPEFREAIS
jgi:hypothetical protein